MEQTRRDTRILGLMAAVIAVGAIIGVAAEKMFPRDQPRPTAFLVPVHRRVIPWSDATPGPGAPSTVTWPTLVSGISAPESVYAGGTLRYRITLRNNGPDPVALRPCPAFEQTLSAVAGGATLRSRHLVACDSIGTLRAEEEVVLEMRVDVPSTFGAGPVNLLWAMEGGVDTQTTLEVLASES